MLPAQTTRVELLSTGSEEDLGGDNVVGSLPSHFVEHSTHLDLGVSFGVSSVGRQTGRAQERGEGRVEMKRQSKLR